MSISKAPGSLDIGTAPDLIGSSPEHQVFVQSSLDLPRSLQLDLDYRFVSDLPGQKGLPGQIVESYSTADARFAWKLPRGFEIALVGRNLLQPHHPEFGTDPGTPTTVTLVGIKRSAFVQLTWVH